MGWRLVLYPKASLPPQQTLANHRVHVIEEKTLRFTKNVFVKMGN
jgi:hypothetical protein